jgi:hypothetical protein
MSLSPQVSELPHHLGGVEAVVEKHAHLQESVGLKVVLGGCANTISACVTNPVDVVKVRLQLQSLEPNAAHPLPTPSPTRYTGFSHGLGTLVKEEGVRGLMKGWQASFLREYCYSGIRFGMYDVVKEIYEDKVFKLSAGERATTPLYIKLIAGATTGGVGSAIMNPMDLVKVRMQADRTGLRYGNSFLFACKDIYNHDGLIKGFYRGVGPTTTRAMVLTAAQLPSYDHMKETLLAHTSLEEGFAVHITCSMFAGLMAATASSPLDVMKTKIMNECSKTAASAEHFQSSNVMGKVFMQVLRTEGVRGFFKGWLPNWFRLGPHTIISLMVYEELRAKMGLPPV